MQRTPSTQAVANPRLQGDKIQKYHARCRLQLHGTLAPAAAEASDSGPAQVRLPICCYSNVPLKRFGCSLRKALSRPGVVLNEVLNEGWLVLFLIART